MLINLGQYRESDLFQQSAKTRPSGGFFVPGECPLMAVSGPLDTEETAKN